MTLTCDLLYEIINNKQFVARKLYLTIADQKKSHQHQKKNDTILGS